eukprot:SAG25_NODE_361_length_9156_cov_9.406647_2_plen_35_part_00
MFDDEWAAQDEDRSPRANGDVVVVDGGDDDGDGP